MAWRICDAKNWGVPQRRRRVFIVGYLGDPTRAGEVLFESEGVPRDTQEGGEERQVVAALTSNGVGTCGADDNQGQAGHLLAYGSGRTEGEQDLATVNAKSRLEVETETLITHALTGEGFDASEDGTGRGTPLVPIAFDWQSGGDVQPNISPEGTSALQASQTPAIAFETRIARNGRGAPSPVVIALKAEAGQTGKGDAAPCVMQGTEGGDGGVMSVRRLTPLECERLQGFKDGHSDIPGAKDGPRYKAMGNSVAVPVIAWIANRMKEAMQ